MFFLRKSYINIYIFLEICLLPIIFIIFFFGLQPEKTKALYYFFFYTVLRGYFIIFILGKRFFFFNILSLKEKRRILLFFLRVGFLVKLPIFSLHYWLPLAHTEAPSLGSIVLAGLLLKLGGYGVIIIIFLFNIYISFFIFFFCFFGSIIRSLICSFQRDGKVLIAYSSITHINFGVFTLYFFLKRIKLVRFLIIISHGIMASLIF